LRQETLDLLVCPKCDADMPLDLAISNKNEIDDILTGSLKCSGCKTDYPITNGIARFVETKEDYCENFGFQWQKWKDIQIDRLAGHKLSETRFLNDSGWSSDWLAGKLILDGGCGAGRFSDVAASSGARVISCDLSNAIDVCRETTLTHHGLVDCIQASLFELPFRKGTFDGVFCMGVIQHTPDPARVIRSLPQFLKSEGKLAYNFYEKSIFCWGQFIKYGLRFITRHMSVEKTLKLSHFLVKIFFPITYFLASIPKIRILNFFIPICASHLPELSKEQQYTWTLLDTFDWYGPSYEIRQRHTEVADMVSSLGLIEVHSRSGIVQAVQK
jgi:2-polyprenyl-3-methyl-5-hydroxy-6-metoxy-1,4-benzoquinol methylase